MIFKTFSLMVILAIAGNNVFAKSIHNQEINCLAENIYHEARSEPIEGMVAVAQVVFNRVSDKRFPSTVCTVVKQTRGRIHSCQFSWFCDGKPDDIHKSSKAWKTSYNLAYTMYYLYNNASLRIIDMTHGATHYHADYVNPRWSRTYKRVLKVGRHIFYRAE